MDPEYANILIPHQGYKLILEVLPGSCHRDGIRGRVLQSESFVLLKIGSVVLIESPFRVGVMVVMPDARLQAIAEAKFRAGGVGFAWGDFCKELEAILDLSSEDRIKATEDFRNRKQVASFLKIVGTPKVRYNGFKT